MLTHLHIKNYALIESLDIDIHEGYTVITGETGAGKSILLGALGLLLGGRADARVVKDGSAKCVVEATFSLQGLELSSFFEENELEYDDDECVVRRELSNTGKSRAFVNDSPVLLSVLKPLGAKLIDIHSQHQNLLIGNEDFLLQILDLTAHNEAERADYTEAYQYYQQAHKALTQLRKQSEADSKEQDFLRYQLQQLSEFAPVAEEQDELEQEQKLLAHAEEIKECLFQASGLLASEDSNLLQNLRHCEQLLGNISEHLPLAAELRSRIESSRIELNDILSELTLQEEAIEFDPQRLSYVDDRLAQLYQLLHRHEVENEVELCEVYQQLQQRLNAIDNLDEELLRCERDLNEAGERLSESGKILTETREKAAKTVSTELASRIAPLGMPHGQVLFDITPRTEAMPGGMDSVQLMFSANKNVPPRNVQDIASGGEVARLMLSLKAYIARYQKLPTIVFDEIDTGVSGTMAERMGQVMQELAQYCQVICITHLPQIAALGSHHFLVHKEEDEVGTHSHIIPLTTNERIDELANMLSGSQVTEAAISNAKSLLGLE